MAYPSGSRPRARVTAMRFAMWANRIPPHLLTYRQVSGLMDISYGAAKSLLRDYHRSIRPIELDGVPGFLTPSDYPISFFQRS